jgi:hypothetical protein
VLSGCGVWLEYLAEDEMTDSPLYDKYVCEDGELSSSTAPSRQGCNNNKSLLENTKISSDTKLNTIFI